jgi:uncharacterized membrane protein
METEKITQLLIFVHIVLGGIALVSGALAIIAKKGKKLHKISGKVFFYSLLTSAITSLVVSNLPNHNNSFLFSIGIFSSYFLITGYRSLYFKKPDCNLNFDKFMAVLIILTGVTMILYPILFHSKINIVLLVFGLISLAFGIRDINLFRDKQKLKEKWLTLHIGKMLGGYIAAVSAFFVVNQILPGIWNWFVPTIVGTVYITYWINKVDKDKTSK